MSDRRKLGTHIGARHVAPAIVGFGLLLAAAPLLMNSGDVEAADPPIGRWASPKKMDAARERIRQIGLPDQTFSFVRIRYSSGDSRRGGGWATDYPDADKAISQRLAALTSLDVNPDGLVMELTDDRLQQHPFIYVSEPGRMSLSNEEATSLRAYLDSGGFLMVDDFWGDDEWRNLQSQLVKVFPQLTLTELPLSHPIFHCALDLKEKPQVCSIAVAVQGRDGDVSWERPDGMEVHYRGLFDKNGRLMAVFCHNTDLADGWERHDAMEWYAREFSEKRAFPMGINILVYALTPAEKKDPKDAEEADEPDDSPATPLSIRVKRDARGLPDTITFADGTIVDADVAIRQISAEDGYWTSRLMQEVEKPSPTAKTHAEAKRLVRQLLEVSHGRRATAEKLLKATRFDGGWVVQVDHDFKNHPRSVMAVHPYELLVDEKGHLTRLRQRCYWYLGSADVYGGTVQTVYSREVKVNRGIHYPEVLSEELRIAWAKERGQELEHGSRIHYPHAVISARDPATEHTFDVESNGSRIFVKNKEGATERILQPIRGQRIAEIIGTPGDSTFGSAGQSVDRDDRQAHAGRHRPDVLGRSGRGVGLTAGSTRNAP